MHHYPHHVIQPINGDTDFYFIAGFEYVSDAEAYCDTYNSRGMGECYGFNARVWSVTA